MKKKRNKNIGYKVYAFLSNEACHGIGIYKNEGKYNIPVEYLRKILRREDLSFFIFDRKFKSEKEAISFTNILYEKIYNSHESRVNYAKFLKGGKIIWLK